ncbi:unnamed protein product, partial [Mesorhabditis belari]|uniref:Gustatory receptor n=1 Tax=Mesorhabditis belari TaxID=2138241 RepID=A0AAF3EU53_9BILA
MKVDERESQKNHKKTAKKEVQVPLAKDCSDEAEEDEVRFVKKNGKVLASDGCDILDFDLSDPACRQFCLFAWCITFIGIRFRPFDSKLAITLRLIYQGLVIALCLYTCGYDFYHAVYHYDPRTSGTAYQWMVVVAQAMFSQFFLTKAQLKLWIPDFFHTLKHARIDDGGYFDKPRERSIRNNTNRFLFLFFTAIGANFCYFLSVQFDFATEVIHSSFRYTYIYEELVYLRLYLIYFNMEVWAIALHTYMCLSNIMYWEAKKFNRKLKEMKAETPEEMVKKVEEMILIHTQLNRCVRELDQIFKIYAFLIVCSIVPSTLFTAAMVLTRTSMIGFLLWFV